MFIFIFIKKLTKSLISGSIAQFDKIVFPLAKHDAIIKFSVAPTEILGNLIYRSIFRYTDLGSC